MPQYEIKDTESAEIHDRIVKVRARTPEEAVRRHLDLDNDHGAVINIDDGGVRFDALEGWHDVRIDDVPVLQIRVFQRMKFRRV